MKKRCLSLPEELKNSIRAVPDFPTKGIIFRDITTLLQDKAKFRQAIDLLAQRYRNEKIDVIVAVDARGFIIGGALAYKLKTAFVPVRKKGKLPYKTNRVSYTLEYGTDTLEMHRDAFPRSSRVLVVDDLLATGGTAAAVVDLVEKSAGKVVGIVFLIELSFLEGRKKLKGYPIFSLIKF